ncbi:hypothetical protein T492DRAFT_1108592 [Pavlovales sp. CCMP2436]|nr:hypothetical protein T492DRAFT_1108592 [Pavlovales sp. CCMP2436]
MRRLRPASPARATRWPGGALASGTRAPAADRTAQPRARAPSGSATGGACAPRAF